MKSQGYDNEFYKNRNRNTKHAANAILSVVWKRLLMKPNSMVDIGCGVGTFLMVAHTKYHVETVVGVDGNWVPRQYLEIKENNFISSNLENYSVDEITRKLREGQRFDIACCLEVAEHISQENAKTFINKLCMLSDIVVFSAALPKQGGNMHINEQRLSYWVRLFKKNGYQMLDAIRGEIWNDSRIPVWYRNNAVIFYNELNSSLINTGDEIKAIVDIVHPDLFEGHMSGSEGIKKKIRRLILKLAGSVS